MSEITDGRAELIEAVSHICEMTGIPVPSAQTSTNRLISKAEKAAANLEVGDFDPNQDFDGSFTGVSPNHVTILVANGVQVPNEWIVALNLEKPKKAKRQKKEKAELSEEENKAISKARELLEKSLEGLSEAKKATVLKQMGFAVKTRRARRGTRMERVGKLFQKLTPAKIKSITKDDILDLIKEENDDAMAFGSKDNLKESERYTTIAIQFLRGFFSEDKESSKED